MGSISPYFLKWSEMLFHKTYAFWATYHLSPLTNNYSLAHKPCTVRKQRSCISGVGGDVSFLFISSLRE